MKTKITTLCIILLSILNYSHAFAQFSEGDVRMYIQAGKQLDEKTLIYLAVKVGGDIYILNSTEARFIKQKGSDKYNDFFENAALAIGRMGFRMECCRLEYVPELSTSARIVYKNNWSDLKPHYAFTWDGSNFYFWNEGKEDQRRTFVEITKEDLYPKPKAINYDFLNE